MGSGRREDACTPRSQGSESGQLSPLTRLGMLALVITPLTALPYLMAKRHTSALRRELAVLRGNHTVLMRELRLHEDRSAVQVKRLHASYRAVTQEVDALRRESYARAGALDAKLESLRPSQNAVNDGQQECVTYSQRQHCPITDSQEIIFEHG